MDDSDKIFAIHTLSDEMKQKLRNHTHHYCDIFTKNILAPLPQKVVIDKTSFDVCKKKRVLIVSYDGKLNLWQSAPSINSGENYTVGTLIANTAGNTVSIVTGSQDGRYAISCFDGYSGKFETKRDWLRVSGKKGIIYGNKTFDTREDLWAYLEGRKLGQEMDLQPIVVNADIPRIILFDILSGLEVSHSYIRGDFEVVVCENYH